MIRNMIDKLDSFAFGLIALYPLSALFSISEAWISVTVSVLVLWLLASIWYAFSE